MPAGLSGHGAVGADGSLEGDNTDGVGLCRDLVTNLGLELTDRKILVLGAGGAVRGVLAPLLELQPASLTIANRTLSRAQELARDFGHLGQLQARAFDALDDLSFDLVINGTAAGLSNQVPPIPERVVGAATTCYDMMYKLEAETAFVAWARANGAALAADGLGMLVEQAAAAFAIWRGVEPDSKTVIESLRNG